MTTPMWLIAAEVAGDGPLAIKLWVPPLAAALLGAVIGAVITLYVDHRQEARADTERRREEARRLQDKADRAWEVGAVTRNDAVVGAWTIELIYRAEATARSLSVTPVTSDEIPTRLASITTKSNEDLVHNEVAHLHIGGEDLPEESLKNERVEISWSAGDDKLSTELLLLPLKMREIRPKSGGAG